LAGLAVPIERGAHHGELNRDAADASGRAVDQQRAAAPDAELVQRAWPSRRQPAVRPRRGSQATAGSPAAVADGPDLAATD
jgi:hypothetical protein